jgi:pimeloyl-ACP methyl ester carboxylesterase
MEYAHTKANDGCPIAFQTSLPLPLNPSTSTSDPRYKSVILLIHGFSGSSTYFTKNFASLSAAHWVIAVDLRGHGRSGRTKGGYHVARLAADLQDLLAHLRAASSDVDDLKIVAVGCSIGAAILWTYAELYTASAFAGLVFVDQAPLQDRSPFDAWDASRAHRGCFDEASMLAAQGAWMHTPQGAYEGLVADCLGYRFAPEAGDDTSEERKRADVDFFTGISSQCDSAWLARLLADHTRYDHREAIEGINVPVLVLAGRRTGCFPLEGMKETVRRVIKGHEERGDAPKAAGKEVAKWVVFESGHWLFYEEPERFNTEVLDFVDGCTK